VPLTYVYGAAALIALATVVVFAVILRTISARARATGPAPRLGKGPTSAGDGTDPTPARRRTDRPETPTAKPQRRRTDRGWDAAALAAAAGHPSARSLNRATRPAPRFNLDDYGLLRAVALVESLDTGQSVRALLIAGGVRATVATGMDGLVRVLVFRDEYKRARRMVSWVL
jgi:hypothetical protein